MKKLPKRINVRFPEDIAIKIENLVTRGLYKNRSLAVRGLVDLGLQHDSVSDTVRPIDSTE